MNEIEVNIGEVVVFNQFTAELKKENNDNNVIIKDFLGSVLKKIKVDNSLRKIKIKIK
jgi:co-chaperonin GroES (HSP10)